MHDQAPGGGRDAGWHRDQGAPDRCGSGLGQGRPGDCGDGAGQVEGHRGQHQPRGIRRKSARGQMSQGGVLQIGVDLLDDRVVTVGFVRGDRVQRAGGEERMEPPGVKQRGLRWVLVGIEVGDAAHHQPPGHLLAGLLRAERGEADLGDLGSGDPRVGGLVEDRVGVGDRRPGVLGNAGDGFGDLRVQPDSDRHLRPGPYRRGHRGVSVERGLCRGPGYADVGARSVAWGGDRPAEVGIIRELRGKRGVGRRAGSDRLGCRWAWCAQGLVP